MRSDGAGNNLGQINDLKGTKSPSVLTNVLHPWIYTSRIRLPIEANGWIWATSPSSKPLREFCFHNKSPQFDFSFSFYYQIQTSLKFLELFWALPCVTLSLSWPSRVVSSTTVVWYMKTVDWGQHCCHLNLVSLFNLIFLFRFSQVQAELHKDPHVKPDQVPISRSGTCLSLHSRPSNHEAPPYHVHGPGAVSPVATPAIPAGMYYLLLSSPLLFSFHWI